MIALNGEGGEIPDLMGSTHNRGLQIASGVRRQRRID
jgi:hypothetical protein